MFDLHFIFYNEMRTAFSMQKDSPGYPDKLTYSLMSSRFLFGEGRNIENRRKMDFWRVIY